MKCEDIKELLSSYLDKELSEAEERLVEVHLLGCVVCAGDLTRLRSVIGEVADIPRLKLPEAAAARLAAAVDAHLAAGRAQERREKAAPRWRWFARPAFVSVATAAGVVAVAVVLWQGPAQNTESYMGPAPSKQEAPEAGIDKKTLGTRSAPAEGGFPKSSGESLGDKDSGTLVFTRKQLDELAKAGGSPLLGGEAADRSLSAGREQAKTDEAIDSAARLAASSRPATLISATQGLFEDRLVWVVVVELNDGGKRVGAAVAIDDGRLLYRSK